MDLWAALSLSRSHSRSRSLALALSLSLSRSRYLALDISLMHVFVYSDFWIFDLIYVFCKFRTRVSLFDSCPVGRASLFTQQIFSSSPPQ